MLTIKKNERGKAVGAGNTGFFALKVPHQGLDKNTVIICRLQSHDVPGKQCATQSSRIDLLAPTEMISNPIYTSNKWMISAYRTIEKLRLLKKGWNGYSADPPNWKAVARAKVVIDRLATMNDSPRISSICPDAEGGIHIYFDNGQKTAYFDCSNDGTVTAATYSKSTSDAWCVNIETEIVEALERMNAFLGVPKICVPV